MCIAHVQMKFYHLLRQLNETRGGVWNEVLITKKKKKNNNKKQKKQKTKKKKTLY